MYVTEFLETKVQKTDIKRPVGPKRIYKPKDGRNMKEWDRVIFFDVKGREFTKTAKQI